MPLYHWKSERFSSYTLGDIFVVAQSVDEARQKALAEHDRQFDSPKGRAELAEDMAAEPETIEVAFVYGSS